MSKTCILKFAIKSLAAVLPGFLLVFLPFELWRAWTAPHEYPFGAEGPAAAMWTYDSQFNYLLTHTTMWFACILALWALFATSSRGRLRLLEAPSNSCANQK